MSSTDSKSMPKSGNQFRPSPDEESGKPFRLDLLQARENLGFSQRVAAAEIGTTSRTLRGWESGSVTPSTLVQEAAIKRLQQSRRPPSEKKRAALKRSHHLHWEENRGWVLRFTLQLDRKLVGKRRKIRLRTFSLEEAIARREILVGEYKRLGFAVCDRRQRKRS